MSLKEDDLKDFFAEFRADDKRVSPPLFTGLPKRKPTKKPLRLSTPFGMATTFFSAAATILLLFLVYWPSPDAAALPSPTNVLVISLETKEETGTESLLTTTDPVFSWESPSASLIADF